MKRKKKLKLPVDRNGEPINLGDVLMWDNGDTVKVDTLTYYGREFESIGCVWVANEDGTSDEKRSDNLTGGKIIWRSPNEQ